MEKKVSWLVTGGAGFIGSNFVHYVRKHYPNVRIINLDKLTYAGHLESLEDLKDDPLHIFVQGDIGDRKLIENLLETYEIEKVINFAAESHVDRSIEDPEAFIQTNVVGTFRLLDTVKEYWLDLDQKRRYEFRFLHISTDEVYGSLGPVGYFREDSPYAPNSPYAASKASSDHFVRAYHKTYGLPTLTTNCSNNYGPYQYPEKLIPLTILNALEGKPIPVYGDGLYVRDWLYVEDHCEAICTVLEKGLVGETYNIGGKTEKTNIEVVITICKVLKEFLPPEKNEFLRSQNINLKSYEELITFVVDRPGHDRRYGLDTTKIETQLGWKPKESFDSGIRKTILWYLNNLDWCDKVTRGIYNRTRLGLIKK